MDAGNREWLRTSPIAHRGLHGDKLPENSMPAFEAAVEAGYGIELDVHRSADGRLIVMHDADVARMTGGDGLVAELPSSQLTGMRLLGTDATVPTLDDVLRMVAGRTPVLIEVKTGSPMAEVGPALVRALRDYEGPFAVQSFDPRVLLWLKKHLPRVIRGQISGSLSGAALPVPHRLLLRGMFLNALTRPNFMAFEVDAMPSGFVTAWRRILRVPVLLWTVRTPAQLARAAEHDANVIFEDLQPDGRTAR